MNGQSSGFFSNEPFVKRPVMTFLDSDFYSDEDETHYRKDETQNHRNRMFVFGFRV